MYLVSEKWEAGWRDLQAAIGRGDLTAEGMETRLAEMKEEADEDIRTGFDKAEAVLGSIQEFEEHLRRKVCSFEF